jgi:hypothetical protein
VSFALQYKTRANIEDLALGECTIHRARKDSARWWLLWFHVTRETDGAPAVFSVPVNPGGSFLPNGPGGRTWGLTRAGVGIWQVAPSINVLDVGDVVPGAHPARSLWHQTPSIVYVPDDESWALGVAP